MSVYQQIRSGHYGLIGFMLDAKTGRRSARGRLVAIARDEMERCGIELVLRQVSAGSPKRGCEIYALSQAQLRGGETRPHAVAVWLEAVDSLVIQPMKQGNSTVVFTKERNHFALRLPTTNESFLQSLNEAFERSD